MNDINPDSRLNSPLQRTSDLNTFRISQGQPLRSAFDSHNQLNPNGKMSLPATRYRRTKVKTGLAVSTRKKHQLRSQLDQHHHSISSHRHQQMSSNVLFTHNDQGGKVSSIASINSAFNLPQVNIALQDARKSQVNLTAEASRQINSDVDLRENANMGSRDIRIR